MEETSSESEVLYRVGESVYLCQRLESTMHLAMVIVFPKDPIETLSKVPVSELRQRYSKKTIGQLVQMMKKTYEVEPDFEQLLDSIIEDRNRLVHSFSHEKEFDFGSEEWRTNFLVFLQDFQSRRMRAEAIFIAFVEAWLIKVGGLMEKRRNGEGFYSSQLYEEAKKHLPNLGSYVSRAKVSNEQ